jgi:hypothetical protein
MIENIATPFPAYPREQSNPKLVTEGDLLSLPALIQRYMNYTGVVGKPWIKTVHLTYSGKFRLGLDKPWMPLSVVQDYTIDPPGFIWNARFNLFGLPFMFGKDVYKAGHSHMHGKLLGLFPLVDGQGAEVDQGTMVRYLQEMMWFPTAYLGSNITWEVLDDHAAVVTLHDHGKSVSGCIYFDNAGRPLSFTAQRYGDFNGNYLMRTWAAPNREYGVFSGLNLPAAGLGVWQLPSGDFSYVDVRLKDICYNQPFDVR